MTTEEDFQAALDANPEDWQTRLVFSDWLQERGDERWQGYKAMGLWDLSAVYWHYKGKWYWSMTETGNPYKGHLPSWWARKIKENWGLPMVYDNRRDADNDAAIAFAKCPEDKKQRLLNRLVLS